MANPLLLRGRTSQVGGYYSITAVARDRLPLLVQGNNASILRDELQCITQEGIADTLAWVAMPDHLHWLFQLQQGSLGRCLQRFKSRSARAINLGMGSSGPLWQGGHYEHCLRSEEDLLAQARYLVANPLRKDLVRKIEDYPFWWCRWVSSSADLA